MYLDIPGILPVFLFGEPLSHDKNDWCGLTYIAGKDVEKWRVIPDSRFERVHLSFGFFLFWLMIWIVSSSSSPPLLQSLPTTTHIHIPIFLFSSLREKPWYDYKLPSFLAIVLRAVYHSRLGTRNFSDFDRRQDFITRHSIGTLGEESFPKSFRMEYSRVAESPPHSIGKPTAFSGLSALTSMMAAGTESLRPSSLVTPDYQPHGIRSLKGPGKEELSLSITKEVITLTADGGKSPRSPKKIQLAARTGTSMLHTFALFFVAFAHTSNVAFSCSPPSLLLSLSW